MLSAMAGKGVIAEIDYWDAQDGTISDERIEELCKAAMPKAGELLAARLFALPSDTTVAASDTMNGVTFGKVRDGWGPFFSRLLGYYFPESCALFETMLREAM